MPNNFSVGYEDLIKSCLAPSIPDLLHRPISDSDFKDFCQHLDTNLKLLIFATENEFDRLPKNALIFLIIVIGEQQGVGKWTTNSIAIKDNLQKIWNKILFNDILLESLLFGCFDKIKLKLNKETWKCNPSAVSCATFLTTTILKRCFKPNKEYYNLLIPFILLQIDDFETCFKLNGLQLLKQMLTISEKQVLNECGIWNVLIDAIKKVLYVKDVDILKIAIECFGFLIDYQPQTIVGKWDTCDEGINNLLIGINMETSLHLRSMYVNALPKLLHCMKMKVVLWLKSLLSIYIEYLDTSVLNNCLDEITICGISECAVTTMLYSKSFIFMFDSIIDKIFLVLLRINNCKIDNLKKEKSIKYLIAAVSLLLIYNKKKLSEIQQIYNDNISKSSNVYKLQWTRIFEIIEAENNFDKKKDLHQMFSKRENYYDTIYSHRIIIRTLEKSSI